MLVEKLIDEAPFSVGSTKPPMGLVYGLHSNKVPI